MYADEGVSPVAGCVPLLLQAPVLALVYSLFITPTIAGHPNALLEEALAGVSLHAPAWWVRSVVAPSHPRW